MSEISEVKQQGNIDLSESVSALQQLADSAGVNLEAHAEFKDIKTQAVSNSQKNGNSAQAKEKPADNTQVEKKSEVEKPVVESATEQVAKKTTEKKAGDDGNVAENKNSEEQEEEEEEVDDPKDAFGFLKKSSKNDKPFIDVNPEVVAFVEKKYGIKEPKKFFESADKWRVDSQKLKEKEEELLDLQEGLGALPQQLALGIQLFSQGKDWTSAVKQERIDFNKNFENHDSEKIVSYYHADKFKTLKNKYEKAEIDEATYKERLADYHDSSKRLYDSDKQSFETQRATMIRNAQDADKAVKESAVSSVEKLKETWPDFKPAQLQKIKQTLVNGDIIGLFKDKNGRYKESAAETLAFAEYGRQMMELLNDRAEKKGRTKATEEIVHRANSNVPGKKSNDANDNSQLSNATQHLEYGLPSKNPFAHVSKK